ncbi:MAG: hypothetical protein ABEJ95_04625 [Candidatus Nanohalobium sp.]
MSTLQVTDRNQHSGNQDILEQSPEELLEEAEVGKLHAENAEEGIKAQDAVKEEVVYITYGPEPEIVRGRTEEKKDYPDINEETRWTGGNSIITGPEYREVITRIDDLDLVELANQLTPEYYERRNGEIYREDSKAVGAASYYDGENFLKGISFRTDAPSEQTLDTVEKELENTDKTRQDYLENITPAPELEKITEHASTTYKTVEDIEENTQKPTPINYTEPALCVLNKKQTNQLKK